MLEGACFMPITPEQLDNVILKGDVKACVKLFLNATEKERLALGTRAFDWIIELRKADSARIFNRPFESKMPIPAKEMAREIYQTTRVAALATCSLPQLKKLGGQMTMGNPPLALEILKARHPDWLQEYVPFMDWGLQRLLVREKLCEKPQTDDYILGMLNELSLKTANWRGFDTTIKAQLLDDPGLLNDEVWRLFEIDGTSSNSLASHDKWKLEHKTWHHAFMELAKEGRMSRSRLLDASLAALGRDFGQVRAHWYADFHELLEPTMAERRERLAVYLKLLGSANPPTVAFALKAVAMLDKEQPVPAASLLPSLASVVNAKAKAHVKLALELMGHLAQREPKAKPQCVLAVTAALGHEAPEVQKAALDFLDQHGDRHNATLVQRVTEMRPTVAATLRKRLAEWLTSRPEVPPAQPAQATEAPIISPPQMSRLDPTRALRPIVTFDELLACAAAVYENPDNPMESERVLDGLARLGQQKPSDFAVQTAPLFRRCHQKEETWRPWPTVKEALGMLFCTWISGRDYFGCCQVSEFNGNLKAFSALAQDSLNEWAFVYRRLVRMAEALASGKPACLLSAPTHQGGWIEPLTLVNRWHAAQKHGLAPPIEDQVLALMRLAPEGRAAALKACGKVTGEAGQALAFALGKSANIGATVALWLAAARSRDPYGDFPELENKHPELGPDGATAAQFKWNIPPHEDFFDIRQCAPKPRRLMPDHLPVLFHSEEGRLGISVTDNLALLRWAGSLCPGLKESFIARGLNRFWNMWEVDHESVAFLEPLADPFTELRPVARMALGIGLAMREANYRTLAIDGLIGAMETGRLNPAEFGHSLGRLMQSGHYPMGRWTKSLGEAARVSPAHAKAVFDTFEHCLCGDPANAPSDIAKLLEFGLEMKAELGARVTCAAARKYLAGLKPGRAAKLARQLLG